MLLTRLQKLLTLPKLEKSSPQLIFWFSLSLTFTAIYGFLALRQAFTAEYVVQDDARQHVFWMQRFVDSELFPNDLIANYFQSVAPAGYAVFYQLMSAVGIQPIFLSKVLPIVLGLITTVYCFGTAMQLLPVPLTGFIASLLLNQNLWMQDGLISATPKAFIYPLFLAFLYYLLRSSLLPCLAALALVGLFYPSFIFICSGILVLRLLRFSNSRLDISRNQQDYLFCATGLGVALLVLSPYILESSKFGPVITAAEARTLTEFSIGKRSSFFDDDDPWRFWFNASRTGIRLTSALMPPLVYAGFLLPVMLWNSSRFPLAKQITNIRLLIQILLASFSMFFAAHALLFKLHLPSRYTQHTLRIVMVLAASIVLTLLLDTIFKSFKNIRKHSFISPQVSRYFPLVTSLFLGAALVLYPCSLDSFLSTGYAMGGFPNLYKFFQQQPKDTLIASLSEEVNNLPSFSQRSILVGSEYAIPYHLGYYRQFRERTLELIQAQYSQNLADAQTLIQKYGVDFWLLDKNGLTAEYIANHSWIKQFKPAEEALLKLQQGEVPAITSVAKSCSVLDADNFVILRADCIVNKAANLPVSQVAEIKE